MNKQEAVLIIAEALKDYTTSVRLDDFEQEEIHEAWQTIVNNLDNE